MSTETGSARARWACQLVISIAMLLSLSSYASNFVAADPNDNLVEYQIDNSIRPYVTEGNGLMQFVAPNNYRYLGSLWDDQLNMKLLKRNIMASNKRPLKPSLRFG